MDIVASTSLDQDISPPDSWEAGRTFKILQLGCNKMSRSWLRLSELHNLPVVWSLYWDVGKNREKTAHSFNSILPVIEVTWNQRAKTQRDFHLLGLTLYCRVVTLFWFSDRRSALFSSMGRRRRDERTKKYHMRESSHWQIPSILWSCFLHTQPW